MPNWSYNYLSIKGQPDKMQEFYQVAIKPDTTGKPEFRMSNIFTMPQKIKDTISPSSAALGRKWVNETKAKVRDLTLGDILGEESLDTGLVECQNNTEEKCKILKAEFGADNWYDWNIVHFGTKWDSGGVDFEKEADYFTIAFDTAWSPPSSFLIKLQQKFPDLDIRMTFTVEGSNDCGVFYTNRYRDSVSIDFEEAELEYRSYDDRDIYFNNSLSEWCYSDTDEVCHDYYQYNPFES